MSSKHYSGHLAAIQSGPRTHWRPGAVTSPSLALRSSLPGAAEGHYVAERIDVQSAHLSGSIFQLYGVHGVVHSSKWKHLLYREASQILVGILLGQLLSLIFGDLRGGRCFDAGATSTSTHHARPHPSTHPTPRATTHLSRSRTDKGYQPSP